MVNGIKHCQLANLLSVQPCQILLEASFLFHQELTIIGLPTNVTKVTIWLDLPLGHVVQMDNGLGPNPHVQELPVLLCLALSMAQLPPSPLIPHYPMVLRFNSPVVMVTLCRVQQHALVEEMVQREHGLDHNQLVSRWTVAIQEYQSMEQSKEECTHLVAL